MADTQISTTAPAQINNCPAATVTPEQQAEEKNEILFNVSISEHSNQGWSKLWDNKQIPWDRGQTSPALAELLTSTDDPALQPLDANGNRRRVLVPGCGNGYDVLLFALMGFEAYGLDVSEAAVDAAKAGADDRFDKYKQKYGESKEGAGSYRFLRGDFFEDDFLKEGNLEELPDIVYDYTFTCAFPPEYRPKIAARHSHLVAKRPLSRLICLEFPLSKDPKAANGKGKTGPPFGLSSDTYLAHLNKPGANLEYNDAGYPDEKWANISAIATSFMRVAHIKPNESHFRSDRISVWAFPESSIDTLPAQGWLRLTI